MEILAVVFLYLMVGLVANFGITGYYCFTDEENYGFRDPLHEDSIAYILLWPLFSVIITALLAIGFARYIIKNLGGAIARSMKTLFGRTN